ncbi:hypothetical protein [Gordonia sp. NPDC003950]
MSHPRRTFRGCLLAAVSAILIGVGFVAGSPSAAAAPSTGTVNGLSPFWVKPELALTRAQVTYDPAAGHLQVTLTHRVARPRGAELGESIDVTSTSKYAMSSTEADGVHIYSHVAANDTRQTWFYITKDGPQSDRGPVTVQVNGASTTYTIDSPDIRALPLHYISAHTDDAQVCESSCMPGGTIDEHRF